ncbi:hypothetical protein [Endozoicomonas sp. ALB115]|uniref:hypothetical protein n=1 Tax=Endozoicomonas sp. ALB115 TaxID=3403074 RepID=UPI003BB4E15F
MFREFRPTDWYVFAGAERFDDGSEPLVSYFETTIKVGKKTVLGCISAIIDKSGLVFNALIETTEETYSYAVLRTSISKRLAMEMNEDDLKTIAQIEKFEMV